MKMTKEIEEFLNLAITEHMGKAYTDWKLKQQTDTEPDKVEEPVRRDSFRAETAARTEKIVFSRPAMSRFCVYCGLHFEKRFLRFGQFCVKTARFL